MQRRTLLRAQLSRAWQSMVETRYQSQLINSEGGLQVYFCHALLEAFEHDGVKRRLFIEPKLGSSNDVAYRYPDVVICNSRSVIGIVELKYLPRGRPSFAKDLATLAYAAEAKDDLRLSNDRYLGVAGDSRRYPLAKDAVLCWGGIYSGQLIDLRSSIKAPALLDRFLQLNARTQDEQHPSVVVA